MIVKAVAMFDHVEFEVADITASRRFYRPVAEALGFAEVFVEHVLKASGYGDPAAVANRTASPFLRLTEGRPVQPTMHLCLTAPNVAAVDAAYAAALAYGGRDNGAPGYRGDYGRGYYAAFVLDPDGHNLEFLYRDLR